ncbi:hypothetical protein Ate02nite_68090 [Paractinoplanes tereljensis]|uniref:Uncharacterized protein n=1 Tax=Paractinoplanes tereljensis TaxID=571912 RepID=A0A919TW68_9ACTN|nr:DUF6023 family protein [Actinoplanes tereljensis]GIF24079.1 hypothetical protein Ate02nite_68090 [Actinoplanes tereljensis]
MGEQTRGVVLYACAALVLIGGGAWWFRAAPQTEVDPQIEQWRATAEKLVPDIDQQEEASTLALAPNGDREVTANVSNGEYLVTVICVGGEESQVRVSLGEAGTDTGRGLLCGKDRQSTDFTVGTAGQFRMNVSVNDAGPVIFRYSLLRQAGS